MGAQAAPTFSVPGFLDETVYQGNGLISLRFDSGGRLFATEKQGRVLVFEPNSQANTLAVQYQYFEGTWTALPDFGTLPPLKTGTQTTFSLDARNRDDNFGFRFTTTLEVATPGTYTFYTTSDDGSRLRVNGQTVVDNDGLHGSIERSGSLALAAGNHVIQVDYFENGGGENLSVSYEGPGLTKQVIGANTGPFLAPKIFADLRGQVNADGERGLLGLALDPDFSNNRYLYLLYSTPADQRLVRLTADATFTSMVPGSETVLLSGLPNVNPVHKAGDIRFHPNDPYSIYVMLGDDGDRYVVSDLSNYRGKILKVDSSTGQGLASNPFWDGNPLSVQSRIWAHSFRNPFRFSFDPSSPVDDVLYISENGDGTDRLVRISKGADGGWPNAFTSNSADGKRIILQTSDPSKTAIAFLRGGVFAPDAPMIYNARYGGDDRKEVRRWSVTGPQLDTLTPVPADAGEAFLLGFTSFNIVSFEPGPDGALYFSDSNQGTSTGSGYRLGRIRFQGGEQPEAGFSTSPDSGEAPLQVQFTDASLAPGSSIATWSWDFGDGTTSTVPNPVHVYSQPGKYPVRLSVANASGLTDESESLVRVHRVAMINLQANILNADTPEAVALGTATELQFYEDDGQTPLSVPGGTGVAGNVFAVAAGGHLETSLSVAITGPGFVISAGENSPAGLQAALIGVEVPTGSGPHSVSITFRLSGTLLRGRILDTRGLPAPVDIGISRGLEGAVYPFPGARDVLPGGVILPAGIPHRVTADPLGYYHIPVQAGTAGVDFHLDTTADTLTNLYGRTSRQVFIPGDETTVQDLVLGLYDGATGTDDLSAIAETPNVDFLTQIQPIFTSSCVACHNDIATNSGGLDLQEGSSFQELFNRESVEAPGVRLVAPGNPARSYLMEKISSALPQIGTRMRPGDPMPPAQQALIRDWISQSAKSGLVEFGAPAFSIQEAGGARQVQLVIRRGGTGEGTAQVRLQSTSQGTAGAADFTPLDLTLTWTENDLADKVVNVSIRGDAVAEGQETISFTLTSMNGTLLGNGSATTLSILDRPWDTWRTTFFGASANESVAYASADPDGDGVMTGVEFAFGTDPLSPESLLQSRVSAEGDHLLLKLPLAPDSEDLTLTVEGTSDLNSDWLPVATKPAGDGWTTENGAVTGNDPETGWTLISDSADLHITPRRFLRLRAVP